MTRGSSDPGIVGLAGLTRGEATVSARGMNPPLAARGTALGATGWRPVATELVWRQQWASSTDAARLRQRRDGACAALRGHAGESHRTRRQLAGGDEDLDLVAL
jgi:hypothetical protein